MSESIIISNQDYDRIVHTIRSGSAQDIQDINAEYAKLIGIEKGHFELVPKSEDINPFDKVLDDTSCTVGMLMKILAYSSSLIKNEDDKKAYAALRHANFEQFIEIMKGSLLPVKLLRKNQEPTDVNKVSQKEAGPTEYLFGVYKATHSLYEKYKDTSVRGFVPRDIFVKAAKYELVLRFVACKLNINTWSTDGEQEKLKKIEEEITKVGYLDDYGAECLTKARKFLNDLKHNIKQLQTEDQILQGSAAIKEATKLIYTLAVD